MALMTCMGDDEGDATRSLNRKRGKGKKGKGKGKGKGESCPSVQDIETVLEEQMEGRLKAIKESEKKSNEPGDLCVLYMMGWINDDGDFNEETFGADVMTLPPRCLNRKFAPP